MAVEFKVTVQDTPGTLARLGTILGEAQVNIEAIQGTSREGKGFVQFVPGDEEKAAVALDAAKITYSKREVLVVRVLDEPGMLGDVALVMSKCGNQPRLGLRHNSRAPCSVLTSFLFHDHPR